MVFEAISNFFRGLFGGGQTSTVGNINVWMPEFVGEVKDNTHYLRGIARRLNMLAEILERRNRARSFG